MGRANTRFDAFNVQRIEHRCERRYTEKSVIVRDHQGEIIRSGIRMSE